MKSKSRRIFFYDGDCGFCDTTVMFLLDRTNQNDLHFARLQSDFARSLLDKNKVKKIDLSTAYYYDGSEVYKESEAILKALSICKNPYRALSKVVQIVPLGFRNRAYRSFAKYRHTVSSRLKQNCRILATDERQRFIS
nr:DCC1-like thiol-disulfide oxidoreductase family protein [uncultured Allomuricauda sp.]